MGESESRLRTIKQFIIDNFNQKTNKQIAQKLGIKIQALRPISYLLGLNMIVELNRMKQGL